MTRRLTSEEREAWLALAALLFTLPPALDSQLQRDEDLTMADYMVLNTLSEHHERRLRMSDLAATAQTSQSRLSRIVARLEHDGYVRRSMAAGDRRVVVAQLTQAGLEKVVKAAPKHLETVRQLVLNRLDAGQIGALTEISRALLGDSYPPSRNGQVPTLAAVPGG
ncbi:MAG TPA: MarR family transcriptional regulator [Propionibacteriaceae bacterium]|nr:MarR family transcriptional regulator [Propionibacteriaceae bacterium]